MFRHEARRVAERPSYCCVLLMLESERVAVFYMDSTKKDAFGDEDKWKNLENVVVDACTKTRLTHAISDILKELQDVSTRIQITD